MLNKNKIFVWINYYIVFMVIYMVVPSIAKSQPLLQLPYPQGISMVCSQANYGDTTHNNKYTMYDLDFPMKENTPVVAASSGIAYIFDGCIEGDTNCNGKWGNNVRISHGDTFTLYSHLSSINVKNGQYVNQGDIIGIPGNTGFSTKTHLHFGLHKGDASSKYSGFSIKMEKIMIYDEDKGQNIIISGENFVEYQIEYTSCNRNYNTCYMFADDLTLWHEGHGVYNMRSENGYLLFEAMNDPYIFSPILPSGITSEQFQEVEVVMNIENQENFVYQDACIYYITDDNEKYSESKKLLLDTDKFKFSYAQDLIYRAKFNYNTPIKQIRIDPIEYGNNTTVKIKSIRFLSNKDSWNFNSTSQGWGLNNASTYNFEDNWEIFPNNGQPHATSPWLKKITNNKYKSLSLTYSVLGGNKTLKGTVYFDLTDDNEDFDKSYSYEFNVNANGEIATYSIPLPLLDKCRKIYRVRVDFYKSSDDKKYNIKFANAEFSTDIAQDTKGNEIFFIQSSFKKRRKLKSNLDESNIRIHEINDIELQPNTPIEFKAYAFGCCSEKYKWEFIQNPLNLNIADDGTITGNSSGSVGDFHTIIRAEELYGDQTESAQEEFIIFVNNDPDRKTITIYNDGSGVLDIKQVSVKDTNNSWIESIDISCPFSIDGGHFKTIPISVNRRNLKNGEYNDSIVIISNDPNDRKIEMPISLYVEGDFDAPDPPVDITANPVSWSSNSISIDWKNPDDPSGIVGAFYTIGNPPLSNDDGIFTHDKPFKFESDVAGKETLFLWLKDGSDNSYFKNIGSVDFSFDNTPPVIDLYSTDIDENTDIGINTEFSFYVYDLHAGIDEKSISLKIKDEVVSTEISSFNDGYIVKYKPKDSFDFNENLEIMLNVSDLSEPYNDNNKNYNFHVFSANGDHDNDNLSNKDEYKYNTNPFNQDTDLDNLPDGWEVSHNISPIDSNGQNGTYGDINSNGLSNYQEYLDGRLYSADPALIKNLIPGSSLNQNIPIIIEGNGVVAYQYQLDNGIWNNERQIDDSIELKELSEGIHTLSVIGKDQNGYFQSASSATSLTWIYDHSSPLCSIQYSITQTTASDVIAKLIPSEPIIVNNNNGSITKTFNDNGKFLFAYSDIAGNIGTTLAKVNWIEKTEFSLPVEYSSATSTKTIQIPLFIENPYNKEIEGVNALVKFDKNILKKVNSGVNLKNSIFDNKRFNYDVFADQNNEGEIEFALVANGDLCNQSGIMLFLEFETIGKPSQQTQLIIEYADLNEEPVSVNNGLFTVKSPPVPEDLIISTKEDFSISDQLKVYDVDGDLISFIIDSSPKKGTISLDAQSGIFKYTPNKDENGQDVFTFKAKDIDYYSKIGTVTINITPEPDAPIAKDIKIDTDEDTIYNGTLLASDVDKEDELSYSINENPKNGIITIDSDTGSYTYTPNPNVDGTDSFTFYADDTIFQSNIATVSIQISSVNDPPVCENVEIITREDISNNGQLSSVDIDGDTLKYILISSPNIGTVNLSSGSGRFTYTPDKNVNGSDRFTYKTTDGKIDSNISTVNVTITSEPDPPTISVIPDQVTNKGIPVNISFSIYDPDTNLDDLVISYEADSDFIINLNINENGNSPIAEIIPQQDKTGKTSITISVSDGKFIDTSTFDLTINDIYTDLSCEEAYPGDPVFLSLNLTSNILINEINSIIEYDNEVITPTVLGASLDGGFLDEKNYTLKVDQEKHGRIYLSILSQSTPISGTGLLANIHFVVSDTATIGESSILTITSFDLNGSSVLTNSGCVSITGFVTSGNIKYYSSDIPVENVIVNVSGDMNYTTKTDKNGNYLIYGMRPGQYTLTPYKYDKVKEDEDEAFNGISVTDVSRIARYSIKILDDFDCHQKIAADATLNNKIKALDASRIGRYKIGLIDSFNNLDQQWTFLPEPINSCELNKLNNLKYSRTFNLSSNRTNENFTGIKLGDVNGSYGKTYTKSRSKILKRKQTEMWSGNDRSIKIPLALNQILPLEGLDIEIIYSNNLSINDIYFADSSHLESSNYLLLVNKNENNKISIIIFAQSQIINIEDEIVYIEFDIAEDNFGQGMISVNQFDGNDLKNVGGLSVRDEIVHDVKVIAKGNDK